MRIFRASSRHLTWSIEFGDHRGRRRRASTGLREKRAAQICAGHVEALVNARKSGEPPAARPIAWLDSAAPEVLRAQLVRWEVLDPKWYGAHGILEVDLLKWSEVRGPRESQMPTLHFVRGFALDPDCLIGRWAAALAAADRTPKHVGEAAAAAARLCVACGFRRFGDLDGDLVARQLATWRQGESRLSRRTSNKLAQALKQFSRWAADQADRPDPLRRAKLQLNEKADPRRQRRALSVREVMELLRATPAQPRRAGLDGPARALAYYLAIGSGLRANEIRTRRVGDFRLEVGGANPPCVIVRAQDSKHRRQDVVELDAALAGMLETHFRARRLGPGDRPFPLGNRTAEALQADLAAARTGWERQPAAVATIPEGERAGFLAETNELGEVVDFHALRHTRAVWLLEQYQLGSREVQDRMRLSSIALVDRYARSAKGAGRLPAGPDLAAEYSVSPPPAAAAIATTVNP